MAKPLWRQMFDAWEKEAGPAMAQFAASSEFKDMARVSSEFSRQLADDFEQVTTNVLHMLNLPAASDVRKIRRQLGMIDREVRNLRRLVEELDDGVTPAERAELDRLISQFQVDLDRSLPTPEVGE